MLDFMFKIEQLAGVLVFIPDGKKKIQILHGKEFNPDNINQKWDNIT